jgi:hypothetical protein
MEYDYKIKLYTSGEKLPPYLRLPKKAITSPFLPKLFSQEISNPSEFLTRGIKIGL